jgi:hypothetical protein
VVVAISQADITPDSSLSRVLFVLGTYYNLLVIVGVENVTTDVKDDNDDNDKETKAWILAKLLRDNKDDELNDKVLPLHRILLSRNITGRVALVRQLNKVALVVDWDQDVSKQLQRFGYRVALVPNWTQLLD